MPTPYISPPAEDRLPAPLTPEKVRRARERTAAIREELRWQSVGFSRLPDPVDELARARDAGLSAALKKTC